MALVSQEIPNLIQGVSQQPQPLRSVSQGDLQVNGWSSPALGLRKRPGSIHLAKMSSDTSTNAFVHAINRSADEQYVAVLTNGGIAVYDIYGNPQTVHAPNGADYLNSSDPRANFRALTVEDYTFIVNRSVSVAADTSTLAAPARPYEAIVVVKQGNYGKTYSISVNNSVKATYTTPDGTSSTDVEKISTDYIAGQLAVQLSSSLTQMPQAVTNILYQSGYGGAWTSSPPTYSPGVGRTAYAPVVAMQFDLPSGSTVGNSTVYCNGVVQTITLVSGTTFQFSCFFLGPATLTSTRAISSYGVVVNQTGSVIYYSSPTDFTLSTVDGFNNAAMSAYKGIVQDFSQLPAVCPVDGVVMKVQPASQSIDDSYYVQYSATGGVNNTGVWQETCKPALLAGYDPTTMIHSLVRNSDGSFTFDQCLWTPRTVGDDTTNPLPSFVGSPINSVFFYMNRLGVTSGENLLFTQSGKYFNFSRTTVIQLIDSDSIDVSVSNVRVANLQAGVPFNKTLLLFADQAQFMMNLPSGILSPVTISVQQASAFPFNTSANPVPVGKNVYFAADRGNWTTAREYFADLINVSNDSTDISGHVPMYIPAGVFQICASANDDVVCMMTEGDVGSLYVYKYYWEGNTKQQSSWSKWSIPAGAQIIGGDFIGSELILVIHRADGMYLEKINLALDYLGPNEPYTCCMDRKVYLESSALTVSAGVTTFTLPYTVADGESYYAVVGTGSTLPAGLLVPLSVSGTTATASMDLTGCNLIAGCAFTFQWRFSKIFVRTVKYGGAQQADTLGKLQLRTLGITYSDTGYFTVSVTPQYRSTATYTFSGLTLGLGDTDEVNLSDGRLVVPVNTNNSMADILIESDKPLPCAFVCADWEGFYVKRSQSI